MKLTTNHIKAMEGCRDGADIRSILDAKLLREVEAAHPEYIHIGPCAADIPGNERQPYFGALLTPAGVFALGPQDYGVGVRILRAERAYQFMFELQGEGVAWCGIVIGGIPGGEMTPVAELEQGALALSEKGFAALGMPNVPGKLIPLTWADVVERGYAEEAEEQRRNARKDSAHATV